MPSYRQKFGTREEYEYEYESPSSMYSNYSDYSTTSTEDETYEKRRNSQGSAKEKKKSESIVCRPNASPGYWLCCLLPLALSTHFLHDSENVCSSTYKILTITAVGLAVQSLCFFAYMSVHSWLFMKLLVSLVPSVLTSVFFKYILALSWGYGILYGFVVTFCYQILYVRIMRGLPKCFSYGEASLLIEGLVLFVLNVLLQLPEILFHNGKVENSFWQLNVIMMSALFMLLIVCTLLTLFDFLCRPIGFYTLMVLLFLAVTCAPVTDPLPIIALIEFLFSDENRVKFIIFFFTLVVITIGTVWFKTRHMEKASTRVRKIFHVLIILVYVPGLLYQCELLYIATGVALAIFTVLELFRILEVPPIGATLKDAFLAFSDEKDAGILALTPFSLLIGCSLPIWIHPCPCNGSGTTAIALLSGVLATGIGDAAASVIGSKYGRIKWRGSSRSLEGSIAFVISIGVVAAALAAFGFVELSLSRWFIVLAATIVTALTEAHTDQIDNLVLPLTFYCIVNVV